MTRFESVSREEFDRALARGRASAAFRERYARFLPQLDGADESEAGFQVHRGDLTVPGDFTAPGLATLVLGDLTVEGYVDLRNPRDDAFDEDGLFVVLGTLRCRVFAGECGKCCFVDGSLEARDLLLNRFHDSTLVVIDDLRTGFFVGEDVWAEVGGDVVMEYGAGYAMPLGAPSDARIIEPEHDETTSRAKLAITWPGGERIDADALMELVRAGKPVFRQDI